MPEGDTIWLAGQQLDAVLAGRELTRGEFRVPSLATTDLTDVTVAEVRSRGKHLLFRMSDGHTLHTHFRMDGTWRIHRAGERWSGGPAYEIRAVLATAGHEVVGYRLPVLELIMTANEEGVVGHLGPDLLGPDWDLAEAVRRLQADPDRSIGEALLDQRNLAGIGTFYRAEICYLQGIHPRTPVRSVVDLERLVRRVRQLMFANRSRPEQCSTGDRRRGHRSYVFERVNQPCRRCRTPIRTEEFGTDGRERRSYWCPHCQPLTGGQPR